MPKNDDENTTYCEWLKCGGRGHKETKVRRKATIIIETEILKYFVCESCADFAVRELREKGLLVERHRL